MLKQYLLASDFDQTLSFNDSGVALSELIGFHGFHDKVKGLAEMNLVQQGAELSYLILHDPDFRRVRKDHLIETGTRIRYNESNGEVESIVRASAGWGKITVLEERRAELSISHDHIIYMGDGSSDIPV